MKPGVTVVTPFHEARPVLYTAEAEAEERAHVHAAEGRA